MHRGGGNGLKPSHNHGLWQVGMFDNLALWGEKKFVSELKRTYKFQRGVNNILDCHANARNDVKRHTEDNSPKYRMVGEILSILRSFAVQTRIFTKECNIIAVGYVRSTAQDDENLNRLRNKCAMTCFGKKVLSLRRHKFEPMQHSEPCETACRMAESKRSSETSYACERGLSHELINCEPSPVFLSDKVFSRFTSHFSLKSAAFTLAEVLVTLGIIGVVAAMTMPALIQNYRNQVVETRLKKFYSTMNQAIAMSIKDNGDVETWTYFNNDQKDEDGNTINRTDDNDKSFNNYLAPYLKIIDKKDVTDFSGQRRMLYFFEDGSAFAFAGHENRDITFFPKNAEKCIAKENIAGNCAFGFEFYPIANNWMWKYLYGKRMEAVMYKWDGNEPSLYNDSTYGCKNGSGAYCTAIIQRNGWKVPKDYPKRIAF